MKEIDRIHQRLVRGIFVIIAATVICIACFLVTRLSGPEPCDRQPFKVGNDTLGAEGTYCANRL